VNLRFGAIIVAGCVSACQNMPEPYAPPVQRPGFEEYHPEFVNMVNMGDPDAPAHFVQDIANQAEGSERSWRWCQQRPTVKVRVKSADSLKYTIDFAVSDVTFHDTGPVTMSFYVNQRLLDQVRYTAPGQLHFEKLVPSGWVTPSQDTVLSAAIDKTWASKERGVRLGFILTRIGLKQ
jgi:hypothetical protein